MKTIERLFKASLIAIALGVVPAANAALVNVNFYQFTPSLGTAPLESTLSGPGGGLATSWNQFAANSSSGTLVDSTGANTSMTFTTNFSEGRPGAGTDLPVFRASLTNFGRGTVNTLTINNLVPNSLHDIWLMAYRDNATAVERLWGTWSTTNPTTSSSTQDIDSSATRNGTTFQDGVNYALFSSVQANGSGTIAFSVQAKIIDLPISGNDYRAGLSGFQMLAVPEPSAALLGGLGLLAMLRRRR